MIDSFSGVIEMKDEQKCPIQHSNVLLRGCVLRGTEWVVGVVLNTGMDVKVMQAGGKKKTKTPHIESILANQAMGVLIMLIVLCFSGATGNAIFNELKRINTFTYLDENLNDPVGDWFIQFFYYLLLHSSFIPVSLFVMMQLVRFLQAYFMGADLEMYYEESDIRASVRNMTLNEELGQISHIFSDKTGTLTCNNMNFRKASINGVSYGKGITEIGKAAWKLMGREVPPEVLEAERLASKNAVPHVAFYCPDYERDMFYAKSMAEPGTENTAAGTAGAATLSKDAGIRQHNAQMYQVIHELFDLLLCESAILFAVSLLLFECTQ